MPGKTAKLLPSAQLSTRNALVSICVASVGVLRSLRMGIAAAIVAGACGGPSSAAEAQSLDGVWTGRYVCSQGPTGATLEIKTVPQWLGIQVYLHRLLMGWLA